MCVVIIVCVVKVFMLLLRNVMFDCLGCVFCSGMICWLMWVCVGCNGSMCEGVFCVCGVRWLVSSSLDRISSNSMVRMIVVMCNRCCYRGMGWFMF